MDLVSSISCLSGELSFLSLAGAIFLLNSLNAVITSGEKPCGFNIWPGVNALNPFTPPK
jgi:hypothetical protein